MTLFLLYLLGYLFIGAILLVLLDKLVDHFDRGDEPIMWTIVLVWPIVIPLILVMWVPEMWRKWTPERRQRFVQWVSWPLIKWVLLFRSTTWTKQQNRH